ncbi:MAG: HD domain-containing protein [Dehalococcoidia bacterium]|nr:HD domain-containing protein [Dehalococcoidia bacterium]
MPGHAQRVCFIATSIAQEMGVSAEEQAGVFYGSLLHDIGIPLISASLTKRIGLDEHRIFGQSSSQMFDKLMVMLPQPEAEDVRSIIGTHCELGAGYVEKLELPESAARAIRYHHESWDGSGERGGLKGGEIPVEGRILALAHAAETIIAREVNALSARSAVVIATGDMAAEQLDPEIVNHFINIARRDAFWLEYYDEELASLLNEIKPADAQKRSRNLSVGFAENFADIVDAKCGYRAGHSRRSAELSRLLALKCGLSEEHSRLVWWASLVHDIGHLGVPSRIMAKSDILTVEEMQIMQQHPLHSHMVVECLPELADVADWVKTHHEWPDGRGYPDSLHDRSISLEAKIMAVADVFESLTSDRPYRDVMERDDALQLISRAAGTQLDPEVVRLLPQVI